MEECEGDNMFSKNAIELIKQRYAHPGESPEMIFRRVAKAISIRDSKFEEDLYEAMINGIFFPNSPCIRNAGMKKGTLSACFVLPIEDNISSIFETIRNVAQVFQRGGGCGIDYSALRPKGSPLSSGGTSSGAVSFMKLFDNVTEVVKQGGFRRGALLMSLYFSHPEILEFCRAKLGGSLQNANLSVVVTDQFMKKAISKKNGFITLEWNNKKYTEVRAKDILDLIALGTYVCGDPGMLFIDRINKDNKLYPKVVIKTTNPCGEVPLPEWGSCNLGSINISKFVEGDNFNFEKFYDYVRLGARALLNVNTINSFPIQQLQRVAHELNAFGLGIMGFADTLIMLGIRYDSEDCLEFIRKLAEPYVKGTEEASSDSFYKRSIAPTGSLSILANCSHGIEPVFARQYERRITIGTIEEGKDIYNSQFCRTAYEISPEWHIKVQAEFQKYVDAGVSKTINLPNNISVDDIKKLYILAWKSGVKGITMFREGSIEGILKPKEDCSDSTCII